MWCLISVIPVLERMRKDDCGKIEGNLDYTVRPCLTKERQSREGGEKEENAFLVWHT